MRGRWERPVLPAHDAPLNATEPALPFPISDGLYGTDPHPSEDFGVTLDTIAARGERGALVVSLDTLLRMSSNPFFPYLLARIEEGIGAGTPGARAAQ